MTETMKDMQYGEIRLFYNEAQVNDDLERALAAILLNFGYKISGVATAKESDVRVMVYNLEKK